jgi:hypothetical protein
MQQHRFVVNVGGTRFKLHNSTVKKIPEVCLAKAEVSRYSSPNDVCTEYYIEGDPHCFSTLLWYFTHGELHMPPNTCPMVFRRELQFWEIEPSQLAPCCAMRFASYLQDHALLSTFEDTEIKARADERPPTTRFSRWDRIRAKVCRVDHCQCSIPQSNHVNIFT